jgi:hypothetical protein
MGSIAENVEHKPKTKGRRRTHVMEPRMKERSRDPQLASPGAPGGDNLDSMWESANRLVAVGDAAIDGVLSDNPEAFLEASLQDGGQ